MLANRQRTIATPDQMARSGPWMLFSGMIASAVGLAIVLSHNVWRGGALPVVVTLASEGRRIPLIPAERMTDAYKGIGFERFLGAWMVAVLALGLSVTWMAFAA